MKNHNHIVKTKRLWLFAEQFTSWLLSWTISSKEATKLVWLLLRHLSRTAINRGPLGVITLSKEGREQFYRVLSSTQSINHLLSGFTGSWSFLNHKVRASDTTLIKVLLTILSVTKGIRLEPKVNLENITGASKSNINDEIYSFIPGFWTELGFHTLPVGKNLTKKVEFREFSLSSKRGPNGHAMETLLIDFMSLDDVTKNALRVLGGERMSKVINTFDSLLNHSEIKKSGNLRKIAAISDKEGKTREIAILDYFSQQSLKGLHHFLFSILKSKIKQDCTFYQYSFHEKLCKNTREYNSIDLKAATDRFPIVLIEKILEYRLGIDYCKAWHHVMVGLPFEVPQANTKVFYSVGNPMGAYSSWASFALAHHFLIYFCCQKIGIDWKKSNYVMLGDDIVINNNALAAKYKETLDSLGVEISPSKTHKSENFYEFAKRVIFFDREVTPFPFNAIWENRRNPIGLISDLLDVDRKGWYLPKTLGKCLYELFGYLGYSGSRRIKILHDLDTTVNMLQFLRGDDISPMRALMPILDKYPTLSRLCHNDYLTIPTLVESWCYYTISQAVMDLFSETASPGDTKINNYRMDFLSKSILNYVSSTLPPELLEFELPELLPWTSINRQVQMKIYELTESLLNNEIVNKGEWDLLLRSLVLPSDETVFFQRNTVVRVMGTLAVVKRLDLHLELMEPLMEMQGFWELPEEGSHIDSTRRLLATRWKPHNINVR